MLKPEVEVVRFGTEDVIATSGAYALSSLSTYYTRGSEAHQWDSSGYNVGEGEWQVFRTTPSGNPDTNWGFTGYNSQSEFNNQTQSYAWFNGTNWLTFNKEYGNYNGGSKPDNYD